MPGYGKPPSILQVVDPKIAAGIPFGPAGIAAGAVISGIVSLFAGNAEEDAQMERIRKIQEMLEEAKYTDYEMESSNDRIGDVFNTQIIEKLNNDSVGLALSGVLNPGVVQAASMGKMLGARGTAIAENIDKITAYNKSIDLKMAEVEGQFVPQNDLNNFMTGGITGLQTGLNVYDIFEGNNRRDDLDKILKAYFS